MSANFGQKFMSFIGFPGDESIETEVKEVKVRDIGSRVKNVQKFPSQHTNETVCILEVTTYNEMEDLLRYIKNRDTVVICTDSVTESNEKTKILHFMFGATAALDGKISKVKDDIYVSAPSNVNVNHILRETKRVKDSKFRF